MAAPVLTPTPTPRGFGWREWWPLLAGPLWWSVAELASVWLVENGCTLGFRDPAPPDPLPLNAGVLLIGAVALVATLHALYVAWQRWDRALDHEEKGRVYGDRKQFTALAGVAISLGFAAAIIYHTLTALLVRGCAAVIA